MLMKAAVIILMLIALVLGYVASRDELPPEEQQTEETQDTGLVKMSDSPSVMK